MKNENGQIIVFALLVIPLLILISGVIVRGGLTAYVHSRVQRFLDQRALEALAVQAQGLESLGKLNGKARALIDARRKVDLSIKAAMGTPAVMALLKLRAQLAFGAGDC